MNKIFTPLAVGLLLLSSCSTIYKSGQTPDDVYYSPVRLYDEDREEERREEKRRRQDDVADINERQIRMGINNPRWRNFDNDFSYNPWLYGFAGGYYYNPLYCPLPVYNPFIPIGTTAPTPVSTPRTTNLNAYNNNDNYVNVNAATNPKTGGNNGSTRVRTYNNGNNSNNNNNGSALGSAFRRIFNNSNNSGNQNNNNSSNRSYSPSSSSSSGSGRSSSSGGTGVSRPARSGRN